MAKRTASGRRLQSAAVDSSRVDRGSVVADLRLGTPHWFGVVGGPVEAIMIFGPHGERLHLHS